MHASSVHRIIHKVEYMLIESGIFKLPKKRDIQAHDWIVVLVDATDIPIEKSKKTKKVLFRQKQSITV